MRKFLPILFSAFLMFSVLGACSDDEDPSFESICDTSCSTDGHPRCGKHQAKCLAECKAAAANAERMRDGCGDCIARNYKWYEDATDCYGFTKKSATSPECRGACFNPDGGR